MKDPEREVAFIDEIELRAAADGSKGPGMLVGYALKWNTLSSPLKGGFTECFRPAAFTRSLGGSDVLAVRHHDEGASNVFGRTSSRTLRLAEDDIGLRYENDLPDTASGRDLAIQVARGDIRGVSIAFHPRKAGWDHLRSEMPTRVITDADVVHLSYEARPAYRDTSIALRSLEAARAEPIEPPIADAPAPESQPDPQATPDEKPLHSLAIAKARLQLAELD
jgi:HK97 family phage prohead protease